MYLFLLFEYFLLDIKIFETDWIRNLSCDKQWDYFPSPKIRNHIPWSLIHSVAESVENRSSKYIMQLKIHWKLQENGLWELESFGLFLFDWVANDIMTEIINENSVKMLDLINHSTKTNTIERFIVVKNGSNNIMWNWTQLELCKSIALNIISPLPKMKMLNRMKSNKKGKPCWIASNAAKLRLFLLFCPIQGECYV